jgi:uncharacterized protein
MLIDTELINKFASLKRSLQEFGKVAIALSGGVDSTFLAKTAYDLLGTNAVALTVDSEAYPPDSIEETMKLAQLIGIKLIEIKADACAIPEFSLNPPDRCYYCKKVLFGLMLEKAHEQGITTLMDGTNADDNDDYRPGMQALEELNIKSPLEDLGFTKKDIRALSKELGLPTWNKQSFACLASRFPYGSTITPSLLERTWKAESIFKELGMGRYRVRTHGTLARIELEPEEIFRVMEESIREKIVHHLKSLGYTYVTLDLQGYRTGSMNETLK